MKIIFFGTPSFVQPVLDVLKKQFDVLHLRGENVATPWELNADLFVIAAYGKILSPELLKIPTHGALNIHPSLLPKYRGPTPVQTAILNGDNETGVSIIVLDEQLDHGPIVAQKTEPILPTDTTQSLHERLFKIGAELLDQNIQKYIKGQIKGSPQDDSKATFTKKLTRGDGFFDLANPPSPQQLDRMIHAFHPWPGAWTHLRQGSRFAARRVGGQAKLKVVKFLPENKIQIEGGKPMNYKDFLNGYPEAKQWLEKLLGRPL